MRARRRAPDPDGEGWAGNLALAPRGSGRGTEREWVVDEITLSLQEGVGFRATLDPPTAGLLAGLDGRRTLAEVADELARLQGASRESVEQAVLPIARRMLEAGFLVRSAP